MQDDEFELDSDVVWWASLAGCLAFWVGAYLLLDFFIRSIHGEH